jgi:hypothetical protein
MPATESPAAPVAVFLKKALRFSINYYIELMINMGLAEAHF